MSRHLDPESPSCTFGASHDATGVCHSQSRILSDARRFRCNTIMLLVFCLHETRVVRPRHVLATEQTYRQRRVVGLVSRIPQGKADETHAASAVDGMRVSPHFVQQPMQPACSFAAKLPDQFIGQRAIVCSQGGHLRLPACLPSFPYGVHTFVIPAP